MIDSIVLFFRKRSFQRSKEFENLCNEMFEHATVKELVKFAKNYPIVADKVQNILIDKNAGDDTIFDFIVYVKKWKNVDELIKKIYHYETLLELKNKLYWDTFHFLADIRNKGYHLINRALAKQLISKAEIMPTFTYNYVLKFIDKGLNDDYVNCLLYNAIIEYRKRNDKEST